nr:expansin-A1-like [Physcomitrium patens]|eukprot:XP_024401264.1 expansin-A1-like [Physcomitrella patens]
MPAFTALARREGGVAPVFYRRVKCVKRGGVRFTIGGNPYFTMILIDNVGGAGDIRSMRVKGQYGGWVNIFRNWGSIRTCRTKVAGALSFMITTTDGRSIVSNRAANVGGLPVQIVPLGPIAILSLSRKGPFRSKLNDAPRTLMCLQEWPVRPREADRSPRRSRRPAASLHILSVW